MIRYIQNNSGKEQNKNFLKLKLTKKQQQTESESKI